MRLSFSSMAILSAAMLAGCVATMPATRTIACSEPPAPPITYSRDGIASTRIDVLTYNIEGLPFPARNNRGPQAGFAAGRR
jgi:hypothetical protein